MYPVRYSMVGSTFQFRISDTESPSGEIIFLPSDASTASDDSKSDNDIAALKKFASYSSSSESDSEPNLGGFEPPEYDFSLYMFSVNTPQNIEKQIAAIDLQLSETLAFEYMLRASLKDDKKKLLKMLEQDKGKGKVSFVTPAQYNLDELYRSYPDGHERRQCCRRDKEQML